MKLVTNRYFIWALALIIAITSPEISYYINDLTTAFNELIFRFTYDVYFFSFLTLLGWSQRAVAAFVNYMNASKRGKSKILWVAYSIAFPTLSLVVQGFHAGKSGNSKVTSKKVAIGSALIVAIFIVAAILNAGIKRYNFKKIDQQLEVAEIDQATIKQIDNLSAQIDSTKSDYFFQDCTTKNVIKIEKYVPGIFIVGKKIIYIRVEKAPSSCIRAITFSNNSRFENRKKLVFDDAGRVVLKEYHNVLYKKEDYLEMVEKTKEYYQAGSIVKRDYQLVDLNGGRHSLDEAETTERPVYPDFSTLSELRASIKMGI